MTNLPNARSRRAAVALSSFRGFAEGKIGKEGDRFKHLAPGSPFPPMSLMEHMRGKWRRRIEEAGVDVTRYGSGTREARWAKHGRRVGRKGDGERIASASREAFTRNGS